MTPLCLVANVVALGSLLFTLLITRRLGKSLRASRLHCDALADQTLRLLELCGELQAELDQARGPVLAAKEQNPPGALISSARWRALLRVSLIRVPPRGEARLLLRSRPMTSFRDLSLAMGIVLTGSALLALIGWLALEVLHWLHGTLMP